VEAGLLDEEIYKHAPNLGRARVFLEGNTIQGQHAWYLGIMNKALATADLPERERLRVCEELHTEVWSNGPWFARHFVPAFAKIVEGNMRTRTNLQLAITAMAIERFRLKNKRWPDSLEEIVAAKFLEQVPEDPITGKSLRLAKMADGVMVYSHSRGSYDPNLVGGDPREEPDFFEYQFRLWDEPLRGQPPPAAGQSHQNASELLAVQ
jgi:hypothetical protein